MQQARTWFLIAYDVRDQKRLRMVAKKLQSYGTRIQLSVFRCCMSHRAMERLKWELAKIMDTEDDLLIIRLCSKCADRVSRRNSVESWMNEITEFEII
jgi:CRISPR-associated protein Cas2